mmetsp:Transcript_49389/g.107824  ORF Transcript_49389/g.107824 Transcript_49389/m.107824 type:complete len:227 (-) Transcript_49389:94-774(-)
MGDPDRPRCLQVLRGQLTSSTSAFPGHGREHGDHPPMPHGEGVGLRAIACSNSRAHTGRPSHQVEARGKFVCAVDHRVRRPLVGLAQEIPQGLAFDYSPPILNLKVGLLTDLPVVDHLALVGEGNQLAQTTEEGLQQRSHLGVVLPGQPAVPLRHQGEVKTVRPSQLKTQGARSPQEGLGDLCGGLIQRLLRCLQLHSNYHSTGHCLRGTHREHHCQCRGGLRVPR